MKKTLWAAVLAAVAMVGASPQAFAAVRDNNSFNLALAPGVTCFPAAAHARVTVSDLGPFRSCIWKSSDLPRITNSQSSSPSIQARPFGFSWYQGDVDTDAKGNGVADYTGIFSDETFLLADQPVAMGHIGIWFADPNDAARAGCPDITTPFDGDHEGGILVFSTSNFPDDQGPLLQLGRTSPLRSLNTGFVRVSRLLLNCRRPAPLPRRSPGLFAIASPPVFRQDKYPRAPIGLRPSKCPDIVFVFR